jgi:hypothetical protein
MATHRQMSELPSEGVTKQKICYEESHYRKPCRRLAADALRLFNGQSAQGISSRNCHKEQYGTTKLGAFS